MAPQKQYTGVPTYAKLAATRRLQLPEWWCRHGSLSASCKESSRAVEEPTLPSTHLAGGCGGSFQASCSCYKCSVQVNWPQRLLLSSQHDLFNKN
mmetsp:Transcript_23229/g.54847  ORF Transcript_23229/g.54847 Transcript_23229/m.54847 type:complete len:95 (+) Transcript_23229:103-387(+)